MKIVSFIICGVKIHGFMELEFHLFKLPELEIPLILGAYERENNKYVNKQKKKKKNRKRKYPSLKIILTSWFIDFI